jgi:lipoyl(octanoyl) transferase
VNAPSTAPAATAHFPPEPEGFKVWRPGVMAYREAQACQEELINHRQRWPFDLLIILEHPPVITFGRNTNSGNLLWSAEALQAAGIECVVSRRGGDITLHGPGQMVGYPIVDLNHYNRDLHRFLRLLEEVLIRTLHDFGLEGGSVPGKTGVWVSGRKIASIGLAVRRWISYHGFALNVDNDLGVFDAIVPCGLPGVTMTSMTRELDSSLDKDAVVEVLIHHFGEVMRRPLLGCYHDEPTTS